MSAVNPLEVDMTLTVDAASPSLRGLEDSPEIPAVGSGPPPRRSRAFRQGASASNVAGRCCGLLPIAQLVGNLNLINNYIGRINKKCSYRGSKKKNHFSSARTPD